MARRDRNKKDPSRIKKEPGKARAVAPNYTPLQRTDGTVSFETEIFPERFGRRLKKEGGKRNQRTYPSADGSSITVSGYDPSQNGRCTDSSNCSSGFFCVDGVCTFNPSPLSQKKQNVFSSIQPGREPPPGSAIGNSTGNAASCAPEPPKPPGSGDEDSCAPIATTICTTGQCGSKFETVLGPNPNCPDIPECDCGPMEVCEDGVCVPVECKLDSDCEECFACNSSYECEQKCCILNSDCPLGTKCVDGECVPLKCCEGEPCPDRMVCVKGLSGTCFCTVNDPEPPDPDCPSGWGPVDGRCVPLQCPCPRGYVCEGGQCKKVDDDDELSDVQCTNACTNFYKANGNVGGQCNGLACEGDCEDCNSAGLFGNTRCGPYSPSYVGSIPCYCDHPAADQPGGPCEYCDAESGEIEPTEKCETCCTAPARPCPGCNEKTAPPVKVCLSLKSSYEVNPCQEAYEQQMKACDDGPPCCDPEKFQCTWDGDCGGGWIWAGGSDTAILMKGKCGDGWDNNPPGICYTEDESVPVDPVSGQPT